MKQCRDCIHYNPINGEPPAGWCEFIINAPVPFWIENYRHAVEKNGADVVATDGDDCAAFTTEAMTAVNRDAAFDGMVAALRESESEVAETKKNLIEVRASNYQGLAHPRFDKESEKELARLEALLHRIRAALAAAERQS